MRLYAFGTIAAAFLVFSAQIINIFLDLKYRVRLRHAAVTDLLISLDTDPARKQLCQRETETILVQTRIWFSFCNDTVTRDIIADFCLANRDDKCVFRFSLQPLLTWVVQSSRRLFTSVVFAYYRQMLDPNAGRAASNQYRMQAFQPPPGAPYGAAYAPGSRYGAPPAGQTDYVSSVRSSQAS